jgi:uncharacterized membrane protein
LNFSKRRFYADQHGHCQREPETALGTSQKEKMVHLLFDIGVVGKGVDGVLEIVGGLLLCLVSPSQIYSFVRMLTQHELSEDPRDLLAGYLMQAAGHLSVNTQIFAAVYLMWHGIIKVGLVIALLQKRFWAYPAAIVAFMIFLIYQLYRYTDTHAPWLLVVSVLDLFVIILTWLEYRRLRGLRGFA